MKRLLHVNLILLFLLSGCAIKKEITFSEAYIVTIKTPTIALSDTGFLNRGKNYANVQIFAAGNVLFNLEMMGDYICLDGKCLDKLNFNQQFFHQEHYAELLQDIINKEPIYYGEHLRTTPSGFEQEFDFPQSHIVYKIENGTLLFKDTKNNILIRFKPLK